MNAVCYELGVTGLSGGGEALRASQFLATLDALARTARRATRLLVAGSGSLQEVAPGWLADATDFMVTGLKPSPTVIQLAALPLRAIAPERFARREFGGADSQSVESYPEATTLDLAARAVEDAKDPDSDGKWFDSAVLEAILDFPIPTYAPSIKYTLTPVDANGRHHSFSLGQEARQGIRKRFQAMPLPRTLLSSGQPEEGVIELDATYSINLHRIVDRWPGDESIEELMEMLD